MYTFRGGYATHHRSCKWFFNCIALNSDCLKIWPITTIYIKTFRLPTPLLIFQLALIPGAILVGFLLSPLLYLSRYIAQRPIYKLRYPEEKLFQRKMLAFGFYSFAALIVFGLIGMWTRWCLSGRDPWVWAIFWILEGRRKWSRPALLVYWMALASISVAAWGRQLLRSRRYRHKSALRPVSGIMTENANASSPPQGQQLTTVTEEGAIPQDPESTAQTPQTTSSLGLPVGLPSLPSGVDVSMAATEIIDAADKRIPTLSLNARRKSFHALAVIMFLPGIAFDVSVELCLNLSANC